MKDYTENAKISDEGGSRREYLLGVIQNSGADKEQSAVNHLNPFIGSPCRNDNN